MHPKTAKLDMSTQRSPNGAIRVRPEPETRDRARKTYTSKFSFQYGFKVFLITLVVCVCSASTVMTAKGSGRRKTSRFESPSAATTDGLQLALRVQGYHTSDGKRTGYADLSRPDGEGRARAMAMTSVGYSWTRTTVGQDDGRTHPLAPTVAAGMAPLASPTGVGCCVEDGNLTEKCLNVLCQPE